MKSILVQLSAAASLSFLFACGGSGGSNAAASKSFNYGAPQAPSSSEQSAATTAQGNLSATAAFSSAPDATKGVAIIGFADTLAGAAFGNAAVGLYPGASTNLAHAVSTADIGTCATVTADKVTYNNCAQTEAGFGFTLNGTITASAGKVAWNISGTFSGTEKDVAFNISIHESGTLTATASKLSGSSLSELGGSVTGQGRTLNFGVSTAALIDLTYQTSPTTCVTGGSVEVKRVWTQKPDGASGAQFADAGIKLSWSGCDAVQVSHST